MTRHIFVDRSGEELLKKLVCKVPDDVIGLVKKRILQVISASHVHTVNKKSFFGLRLGKDIEEFLHVTANQI
jgi:hypothetical protein